MKYLLLSVVFTAIILSISNAYAEEHIIVPNVVAPVVTIPTVDELAAEHHEVTEEFEVLDPQYVFIEEPVTEEPIEIIEWEEPSLWDEFIWWLTY
jgi:hypothetical protein